MAQINIGKVPTETGDVFRPSQYKYLTNTQYVSIGDIGRHNDEDNYTGYVFHNGGSCRISINSASDLHWTAGWVGRKWKDWNNYYKSATVRRSNSPRVLSNTSYKFKRYPRKSSNPKVIKMLDSSQYGTYGTFSYAIRTIPRNKKNMIEGTTNCQIFKKVMLQDIINHRGKKLQRMDKYYQDTSSWVFRDTETNKQVRANVMEQDKINGWKHDGSTNFYTMGGTAEGNLFHSYRDHLANWAYYGTNYKVKSTVEPNVELIKLDLISESFITEEDEIEYSDKTAYNFDPNYLDFYSDEIFIKLFLTKICPTYDCETNRLTLNGNEYSVDIENSTFTNILTQEVTYYLIDENDEYVFINPKSMLKAMFLEDEENKTLIKKYATLFQFPYLGGVEAYSYENAWVSFNSGLESPYLPNTGGFPENYLMNYDFSFSNFLSELENTDIDTSFDLQSGIFKGMYSSAATPTKHYISRIYYNIDSALYSVNIDPAYPCLESCIDFDYATEFDEDEETAKISGYITSSLANYFMPITPFLNNVSGFSFLSPSVPVYIYLGLYEEKNGVISGYPICYLRNLESGKQYFKYRTPINLNKKVSADISSRLEVIDKLKTLTNFYYYTYKHNDITRMWYFDDNSFDDYVTEKDIVFTKTLPYLNYTWQPFQMSTGSSNCWELFIIIPFVIGRAHACHMSDPPITYYNVYNKHVKTYLSQNLTDIRQFDRVENVDFIDKAAGLDYKNTQKKIQKKYIDEDLWLYNERPFKTRGGKITRKNKEYNTSVESRLTDRPTDSDGSSSQLLNKYYSDENMTRGIYANYLGWGFSWAWFLNAGFRSVSQNIKLGIKYCEVLSEIYGPLTENYLSITLYNPDRIPNSNKKNTFSVKKVADSVLYYNCELSDGNLIFYDKKNQCKYYVTVSNIEDYDSYSNNGILYTETSKLIYNYYINQTTDFSRAVASNCPIIFHINEITDPDILGQYIFLSSANVSLSSDLSSNDFFNTVQRVYTYMKYMNSDNGEQWSSQTLGGSCPGYFTNYSKSKTFYFYYRSDLISKTTASIIVDGLTKNNIISLSLTRRNATLEEVESINPTFWSRILSIRQNGDSITTSTYEQIKQDFGYCVYPTNISCKGKRYESNGDYTTYDLTSSAKKWLTEKQSESDITELILYAFSYGTVAIANKITKIYLQNFISKYITMNNQTQATLNKIYNKYIDDTIYWNIQGYNLDTFSINITNENLANNEELTDDEKDEIKRNAFYLTTTHKMYMADRVTSLLSGNATTRSTNLTAHKTESYYSFKEVSGNTYYYIKNYHSIGDAPGEDKIIDLNGVTYYKENYDGINFYANTTSLDDGEPHQFKYEIPLSELITYKTNILDDLDGYMEEKIFTNFLEYYSILYDILNDGDKAKIDVIKDYIDSINATTETDKIYTNDELIEMINSFHNGLSYEEEENEEQDEESEEENEEEETQSIVEIISFAGEYVTLINRYQSISKYGEYYIINNFDENYKLVIETALRLLEYGYDYSFIEEELNNLYTPTDITKKYTIYETTLTELQSKILEHVMNAYFFSDVVFDLNYYDEFIELMTNFYDDFASIFETFLSTYESAYADYSWGKDLTSYDLKEIMTLLLTNQEYPDTTYGDGTVKNCYYFLPVFDRFFSKCSYYQKKILYELGYTYEMIYPVPQLEPHWQNRHALAYVQIFFAVAIFVLLLALAIIATMLGQVEVWALVIMWVNVALSMLSVICLIVLLTLPQDSKDYKIWSYISQGIAIARIILSIVSLGYNFDGLTALEACIDIVSITTSLISFGLEIYTSIMAKIETKKNQETEKKLEESEEEYEEQYDFYLDELGESMIFYPDLVKKTEKLYESSYECSLGLSYYMMDGVFDTDIFLSYEKLYDTASD